MSIPIGITPVLKGKDAKKFLEQEKKDLAIPDYRKDISKEIREVREKVLADAKLNSKA